MRDASKVLILAILMGLLAFPSATFAQGRDKDGDGINNGPDNCPNIANPDQTDTDGDGIGDACDDTPGDGGVIDPPPDGSTCYVSLYGLIGDDLTALYGIAGIDDPATWQSTADYLLDLDPVTGYATLTCDVKLPASVTTTTGETIEVVEQNLTYTYWICELGSYSFDSDPTIEYSTKGKDGRATLSCAGDLDFDDDGVLNDVDNCPLTTNSDQTDSNGNGIGDACEIVAPSDIDADGVADDIDNCPLVPNPDQLDSNGNGIGDACDPETTDTDGDGIFDFIDNCVDVANTTQTDTDGDGAGNACDVDDDNDGVLDEVDNCPVTSNADQTDTDTDGIGDVCDPTPNGDGGGDPTIIDTITPADDPNFLCTISLAGLNVDGDGLPDIPDDVLTYIYTANWEQNEYSDGTFELICRGYLPDVVYDSSFTIYYPQRDYAPSTTINYVYAPGCTFLNGSTGSYELITYNVDDLTDNSNAWVDIVCTTNAP